MVKVANQASSDVLLVLSFSHSLDITSNSLVFVSRSGSAIPHYNSSNQFCLSVLLPDSISRKYDETRSNTIYLAMLPLPYRPFSVTAEEFLAAFLSFLQRLSCLICALWYYCDCVLPSLQRESPYALKEKRFGQNEGMGFESRFHSSI